MYLDFYQLQSKPFCLLPKPDVLFMGRQQRNALDGLMRDAAGVRVLVGGAGTGKTLLLNYFLDAVSRSPACPARIGTSSITARDFYRLVLRQYGIAAAAHDLAALREVFTDLLIREYFKETNVVLVVDEAQSLPAETLDEIGRLAELNTPSVPLVKIILAGHQRLLGQLLKSERIQLQDGAAACCRLGPLDAEETAAYIAYRLQRAGSSAAGLMTAEAIECVYRHSKGVPRVITVLCDLALVSGFRQQVRRLSANMITDVARECGLYNACAQFV